jgi:hypothetical protein
MPFYAEHLRPYRFRRNVVYEIGVGGYESSSPGGSLAIWRDYLLRSQVIGIDLYPKHVRLGRRVAFCRGDQSNDADLGQVCDRYGNPDIVIDDGSHIGGHVLASFRFLFDRLSPGGIYVIEDLSTSYDTSHGGGDPPPAATAVGLLQTLVDSTQSQDTTFLIHPDYGPAPALPAYPAVANVHVYPGIAFILKGVATVSGGSRQSGN